MWNNLPTGSCLICSFVKHIGDKNKLLLFVCDAAASVVVVDAVPIFGLLLIGSGFTLAVGKFVISVKSGNVSNDGVVCADGCWTFAWTSGFINDDKLHLLFSMGIPVLLSFVESSLDESADDVPSEPLSLEFSIFL